MALLDSEINRIRYELGSPNLSVLAEPYIGIAAVYTHIVQPYLLAGAKTTSTTAVTAATSPTLVTLTLASATGVEAGATVVVDVDARQERATVESVSGSTIAVLLSLAHSGTYPVTVEGGESIVRDILRKLRIIGDRLESSFGRAGIKKVDEVEFFEGGAVFTNLMSQREYWRGELARVLFGSQASGTSNRMAVY